MAKNVKGADLQLGDIIKAFDGPYSYATVQKIESDRIHLYRPHIVTQDFSYSGGVMCSVAIEQYSVPTHWEFEVVQRKGDLK